MRVFPGTIRLTLGNQAAVALLAGGMFQRPIPNEPNAHADLG